MTRSLIDVIIATLPACIGKICTSQLEIYELMHEVMQFDYAGLVERMAEAEPENMMDILREEAKSLPSPNRKEATLFFWRSVLRFARDHELVWRTLAKHHGIRNALPDGVELHATDPSLTPELPLPEIGGLN